MSPNEPPVLGNVSSGPQPGVVHPADKAFHDLAIKERNHAWVESARHKRERDSALAQTKELLEAVEAHRKLTIGGGLAAFHAERRMDEDELRAKEAEADRDLYDVLDRISAAPPASVEPGGGKQ